MRLLAQLAAKAPPGISYQSYQKQLAVKLCANDQKLFVVPGSLNCLPKVATHCCGKVWT